jgi:hypothetical protein
MANEQRHTDCGQTVQWHCGKNDHRNGMEWNGIRAVGLPDGPLTGGEEY